MFCTMHEKLMEIHRRRRRPRCKESPPEPGGSGQCRFVWLMGLSNLSKDLFMGSDYGGERGRDEGGSMVRRQQQLDSSVTGTRRRGRRGPEQQEFSRAGMIYGAEGDPPRRGSSRVSVFASPSAAPVFVHSPELANIKPLSHHLYSSNTGSNLWRK